MSKVQISRELFTALIKYHLMDIDDENDKIKEELTAKLDALVKRDIYTRYKIADTEAERESARQEYLKLIGIQEAFRW